jgi:hypothetical protein
MISGRDALSRIEHAIAQARGQETQFDGALRSAEEAAARLRAERAAAFRELARVRLDAMTQGAVVQQLDHAERRALDLVKDRTQALKDDARERQRLFDAVQTVEGDRHARAEKLEQALGALESVRQAAQPKIRQSAAWKAQQTKVDEAIRIADEADKKARVAEQDREVKRKPYESDQLFMYLYGRKFGQAEYKSGPFVKFFDAMIARKIGFSDARANYAMLLEIPMRLRNHAEKRREQVQIERAALAKAENTGLAEVGGGELVGKMEAARQALMEVEKKLSAAKQELADFESRKAVAAEDPAFDKALEIIAEADSRQEIQELYAEAARTPTREDERIVRQIEAIDQRLGAANGEVEQLRHAARDMARRRQDIERERDHFRRRGYDNPYGGFGNESILGNVIGGILQGAIQGSILRDALRDGYRQRDNPWGGGPTQMPNWNPPSSSSNDWVPPWLDGGSGDSSGGGWFDSGGGGDGFTTGGGV